MKKYPLVSIIVPIYNSYHNIKQFIRSICSTNYSNFEVIIAEDGSTDGTLEYLIRISKTDSRFTILKSVKKIGLTKSRNVAIASAKGLYIAFAETDMLFDKNWLIEAIKVLELNKTIGAVSGKVLDLRTKNVIQAVGLKIIPQTAWVISIGFGEKNYKFNSTSQEVSMGAVGSVARKSVIYSIRGFDDSLDRIDDIDLGIRIWISGQRIISVPGSITYHVTLKSWDVRKKNVTKIQQEIALARVLRIMLKNYEMKNIFKYFPQAIIILFLRALLNLFKGNVYSLTGLLYTLVWVILSMPSIIEDRLFVQGTRKFSDDKIFKSIMISDNLFEIFSSGYLKKRKKMTNFTIYE